MWLLRDAVLIVGLLTMAVALVVGGAGYIFALDELRTEAVKWGLTVNDLLFIILAVSFGMVVARLSWRLRKAELPTKLRQAKALLWNTAAEADDLLQDTPIDEAAAREWLPSAPAALERVWSRHQAMMLKDRIEGFLNPGVQVEGNRMEHALKASAGQLNAYADQLTKDTLNPDFRP